ncbi:MAG: MarR family transcriptional regulator [Rhodospirillaceae bacterium]|nr:MarR family transcriptional regulator [Rhodospirillaceae bacterium]MBT7265990.1 MarR family transcriptional regulator [Rhodospirillaceae bacterium]
MMSKNIDLNKFVGFKIHQLSLRIANTMARSYSRPLGIGIPAFRIILRLGHLGSTSLVELADASGMDPAVVSRTVEKLEAQGYLIRAWHPDDKRRRVLSLSEEGKDLHAKLLPFAVELQEELVEGLSESELNEFNRILDWMQSRIDKITARRNELEKDIA